MKYILLLLITTTFLFSNTLESGKFESCETNYYSIYDIQFVSSISTPCYKIKSKLDTETYSKVSKSFKKGTFESCGLLGCSIDFTPLRYMK